ncbi:hypothetical protein D3C83_61770 [compost metagenome]
MVLEVARQQRQTFLQAPRFAQRVEQTLRRQRQEGGVLRFDALPVPDGALQLAGGALQVAQLHAGAH